MIRCLKVAVSFISTSNAYKDPQDWLSLKYMSISAEIIMLKGFRYLHYPIFSGKHYAHQWSQNT